MCCVKNKPDKIINGKTECCSEIPYNPAKIGCCGNITYNPQDSKCCEVGNPVKIDNEHSKCCGKTLYNPKKQLCCEPGLYYSSKILIIENHKL